MEWAEFEASSLRWTAPPNPALLSVNGVTGNGEVPILNNERTCAGQKAAEPCDGTAVPSYLINKDCEDKVQYLHRGPWSSSQFTR